MTYEIDVTSVHIPENPQVYNPTVIGSSDSTTITAINDNWHYFSTNPYTYSWNWNYTTTIYKYQLICPRCKSTNWGELDQIVNCSGKIGRKFCSATLKAIKHPVDFEVPVG